MTGHRAGKSVLKSCSMKGKFENVVFIDVDDDTLEDVIVIDAPESVEEDLQGSNGSKGGKHFASPSVISIDDDDGSDEVDDPEIRVESGADLDSDASSRKSCPVPDIMQKSTGLDDGDGDDDDDCWFIREKKPAFKLSKCNKTYGGKTPCGKRFGLGPVSEDSSSESDCSDCELIEGSVGKLQEQWEKASQRKRYNARNGQSSSKDWMSASGSRTDSPPEVAENRSQQYAETPPSSGSGDSNIQKQKSSALETNSDSYLDDTCLNSGTERISVESEKKVDHERPTAEAQFSHVQAGVVFGREGFMKVPLSRDINQEFSRAPSNCDSYPSDMRHGDTVANGKEQLQTKQPSMSIPKSSEEKQVENGMNPDDVEVGTLFDESTSVKTPSDGIPDVCSKSYCDEDSSQNDGTQIKQFFSIAEQSNLISREKLKETDEYKRAMEEEWASRKQVLKIQAEEAQRLRKRRKAEMRTVDMERRQKQRLEEMRETQKKDEENMNLKEQLRMEVRKELSKLEISCTDLASLLRSLGISVGDGSHPLSNEIHAAYKKALLRFHPDRASKTDIRHQVEAEEKFKLISRMKEKFLATSCHC